MVCLIPHQLGGIVLAVGAGEIPAVHGGIAVLQLHLQRLAVGIDEIGVEGRRVVCQLIIGDLTVAEIRDDTGAGIVRRAWLRFYRAGPSLSLAGVITGCGLSPAAPAAPDCLWDSPAARGIGFLLRRLLVRLLRSLRLFRRVLVLRVLRLLRGIGLLLLGGASLSLGADSLGRGLGQRSGSCVERPIPDSTSSTTKAAASTSARPAIDRVESSSYTPHSPCRRLPQCTGAGAKYGVILRGRITP